MAVGAAVVLAVVVAFVLVYRAMKKRKNGESDGYQQV